jgi:tetratricopeptide (TPR) repeat protein
MLRSTQKSWVWNRLGKLYTGSHQIHEAIEAFRQSIEADPNLYENYVDHAVLLRDQGNWVAAMKSVKEALDRNPGDVIARSLGKELRERITLEKDKAKKQRLDQLILELSDAFRNQSGSPPTSTSEVQTITFLDFSSKGRVPHRLGENDYLKYALVQALQDVKGIKVVERVLIDKLLEELKLGSSEIANPAVSVRLGRLLAARCIVIGTIYRFENESEITLKLIDTETSEILSVLTEKIMEQKSLQQAVQRLSAKIVRVLE